MSTGAVARGSMGYGAHSAIHEPHLFSLSHDLPVVVEIVDTDEKVRQFLPCLEEMVREGMITTPASSRWALRHSANRRSCPQPRPLNHTVSRMCPRGQRH